MTTNVQMNVTKAHISNWKFRRKYEPDLIKTASFRNDLPVNLG